MSDDEVSERSGFHTIKKEPSQSGGAYSKTFLAILTRDVFGYLFIGLLFLVGFYLLFGPFDFPSGGGFRTNDYVVATIAIAAAYPVGRILYSVTKLLELVPLCWVVPSFDHAYSEAYKDLTNPQDEEKNGLPMEGKLFGLEVKEENARRIFGKLMTAWMIKHHPTLYYARTTRENTLRIVAESSLSLVLILGSAALFSGLWGFIWTWVISGILALVTGALLFYSSYRLRMRQAKAKIYAGYIATRDEDQLP